MDRINWLRREIARLYNLAVTYRRRASMLHASNALRGRFLQAAHAADLARARYETELSRRTMTPQPVYLDPTTVPITRSKPWWNASPPVKTTERIYVVQQSPTFDPSVSAAPSEPVPTAADLPLPVEEPFYTKPWFLAAAGVGGLLFFLRKNKNKQTVHVGG